MKKIVGMVLLLVVVFGVGKFFMKGLIGKIVLKR